MAAIVGKGINSFKFFMAYKGALMVGDELLLDGMQRCKQLGALAMVCLPFPILTMSNSNNDLSAFPPVAASACVHRLCP